MSCKTCGGPMTQMRFSSWCRQCGTVREVFGDRHLWRVPRSAVQVVPAVLDAGG